MHYRVLQFLTIWPMFSQFPSKYPNNTRYLPPIGVLWTLTALDTVAACALSQRDCDSQLVRSELQVQGMGFEHEPSGQEAEACSPNGPDILA